MPLIIADKNEEEFQSQQNDFISSNEHRFMQHFSVNVSPRFINAVNAATIEN